MANQSRVYSLHLHLQDATIALLVQALYPQGEIHLLLLQLEAILPLLLQEAVFLHLHLQELTLLAVQWLLRERELHLHRLLVLPEVLPLHHQLEVLDHSKRSLNSLNNHSSLSSHRFPHKEMHRQHIQLLLTSNINNHRHLLHLLRPCLLRQMQPLQVAHLHLLLHLQIWALQSPRPHCRSLMPEETHCFRLSEVLVE